MLELCDTVYNISLSEIARRQALNQELSAAVEDNEDSEGQDLMSMEPDANDADLAGPETEDDIDDLTEQDDGTDSPITDAQSRYNGQGVYRSE